MDIRQSLSSGISKQLINPLIEPIVTPIREWLVAHPLWYWLFNHPLWLLALVVMVLFLFAGLLGAISRLTEAIWLMILQAPVKLVQWMFAGIFSLVKRPFVRLDALPATANPQERLLILLNRLEELRQEQDQLLQEARTLIQFNPSLQVAPPQTSTTPAQSLSSTPQNQ